MPSPRAHTRSAFAGCCLPPDVTLLAARWSLWQVDKTSTMVAGQWRCVDRDRPVRPGHRRVRRPAAGCHGCPPILGAGQHCEADASCGRHRPSSDRSGGAGGAGAGSVAAHRAVRQQPLECDHGRLTARLEPMRGRNQDRSARVVIAAHARCPQPSTRPLPIGGPDASDAAGGRGVG